ncbi:MAG: hypothetical protein WCF23_12445 [Candidatus Nitrosopolaris sp.]
MVTEHYYVDDIPSEYQNPKECDTGSEVTKELNDYFNENKVDLQIIRKGIDKGTKYRWFQCRIDQETSLFFS